MVLAHAGGWDEIALIAVPVLVYLLVSRVGRKRRQPDEQPAPTTVDREPVEDRGHDGLADRRGPTEDDDPGQDLPSA